MGLLNRGKGKVTILGVPPSLRNFQLLPSFSAVGFPLQSHRQGRDSSTVTSGERLRNQIIGRATYIECPRRHNRRGLRESLS
jgi:hypothetical protein